MVILLKYGTESKAQNWGMTKVSSDNSLKVRYPVWKIVLPKNLEIIDCVWDIKCVIWV